MALVRWSPWGNLATLQDRINRIFDEAFPKSGEESELTVCDWNPAVDTYEKGETITIEIELPGVDKKDVAVDVKDRVLSIKGKRSLDKEIKEENYYRRERCYGTFHRSFNLPAFIKPENIKAEFKDGILKVQIPKPEEEKPKQISIK